MTGKNYIWAKTTIASANLPILRAGAWLALIGWLGAPTVRADNATPLTEGSGEVEQAVIELEGEDETFINDDEMEELEDIGLFELDVPIVVTAGRREQKITGVPYAISVITSEDIRRAGARTIPDALRLAPGVDVADLAYGAQAVSPRGFSGFLNRQLLVLVDGRQIFDAHFGGTLWGSWPFSLDDIERIEVIRGPGGVIWGANAVNGVINIITRKPADKPGLTLTTRGGSRGRHQQYFGYAVEDNKWSLRISGEYEGSDGFRQGGSILRNLQDDYKAARFNIHAVYDGGPDDTFTLSAGHASVDGAYPPTPLSGLELSRNSGSQATFILAKWEHIASKNNSSEWTFYVNDFFASPGVPQIDYRYQQIALQYSNTIKPSDKHTVTWGVDSRVDLIDTTNSDPFTLSKSRINTGIVGIYVNDEWRFRPRWTLALGGRIDYEFYGGFQPSARASLSYELDENALVYGSVSRAFQVAPASLRFLDVPLLNGFANASGTRGLNAQTLLAYELGYRAQLFERLEFSMNLFWHEYDDMTTLTPTLGPPGLINSVLNNRASVSTYGTEIEAKYQVNEKLLLLGNYTFQNVNWRANVALTDTESMSPPHHKFMLGARYSHTEDLHLSSHLYYVDTVDAPNPANPFIHRQIPPYFRLDLRGEYEFWEDKASFAIGVSNLLDEGHYEGGTLFLNDAQVPRMIFAELRFAIP